MPPGLNPAQHDAVKTLSGPLLVLAGAGTGKTRVVTFRIAELIRSGIRPERILAVTFTRKAAGEMQERASELLKSKRRGPQAKRKRGPKQADLPAPEISTFHSLCVRILRRHIARLDYPERFTIGDRSDQESAARSALREIRAPSEALKPADLLGFISRWKMKSIRPPAAASTAESDKEHLAAVAYRRYQNHLKKSAMVDFDDLLFLTEELFSKFPTVRRDEAARFDHVLVDEYQDTNHSQYEIVKGLAMGHRNLCVVGDDDQSIYAWRGAEVTHILNFKKDWPEAKIVRLEDNYRSRKPIIDCSNTLIVHNAHRHDKVLRPAKQGGEPPAIRQFPDETEEAKQVVADIKKRLEGGGQRSENASDGPGVWKKGEGFGEAAPHRSTLTPNLSPKDIAILFRTNEQPRAFEAELRAANLPYVLIGGMSFYDRREVRDVLAYLKLVANPNDEPSLLRVLNTPPRGIGDAARKLMMEAAVTAGQPLWGIMTGGAAAVQLKDAPRAGVNKLVGMIRHWQAEAEDPGSSKHSLGQFIQQAIDQSRYQDELVRLYQDPNDRDARTAAMGEIVNAAEEFDAKRRKRGKLKPLANRLQGFLDEVAVGDRDDSGDKDSQLERNAIALMTLHAAKGLEFPHVYLVGMEEGILPHKRSIDAGELAIDEERRLAYVGVTRAQERLTLSLALTRRKWGKARDTIPSRFLFEMTGQAEKAPHRNQSKKKAGRRR